MLTICTHRRRHLLGVVSRHNGVNRVELSILGDFVREAWADTAIAILALTILPDHLHAIVRCDRRPASEIVRGVKSSVAGRAAREIPDDAGPIWQNSNPTRWPDL